MTILPGIIIGKVFGQLAGPSSAITLTTGFGDNSIGYRAAMFGGGFGSISAEPFPAAPLAEFTVNASNFSGLVLFGGDVATELSGKTVWVDGVQYATGFSGWSVISGATAASWTSGNGPPFAQFTSYAVEIK